MRWVWVKERLIPVLIGLACFTLIFYLIGLLGILLLALLGWYEYSTYRVCQKPIGEVIKDGIVMILWFLAIWIIVGKTILLPQIKEYISSWWGFPKWTSYLVLILLFTATFRSAIEIIRISRRKEGEKEEEDDPGLFMFKVSFEMVEWFLLFPVTAIFVCSFLEIRWWEITEKTGILILGSGLVWLFVWYQLPRTYDKSQETMRWITPLVLGSLIVVSVCTRGSLTLRSPEEGIMMSTKKEAELLKINPLLKKMEQRKQKTLKGIRDGKLTPQEIKDLIQEQEDDERECRRIRKKCGIREKLKQKYKIEFSPDREDVERNLKRVGIDTAEKYWREFKTEIGYGQTARLVSVQENKYTYRSGELIPGKTPVIFEGVWNEQNQTYQGEWKKIKFLSAEKEKLIATGGFELEFINGIGKGWWWLKESPKKYTLKFY